MFSCKTEEVCKEKLPKLLSQYVPEWKDALFIYRAPYMSRSGKLEFEMRRFYCPIAKEIHDVYDGEGLGHIVFCNWESKGDPDLEHAFAVVYGVVHGIVFRCHTCYNRFQQEEHGREINGLSHSTWKQKSRIVWEVTEGNLKLSEFEGDRLHIWDRPTFSYAVMAWSPQQKQIMKEALLDHLCRDVIGIVIDYAHTEVFPLLPENEDISLERFS